MIFALALLIAIAVFIEFLEFNLEQRRAYILCKEHRYNSCKGVVDKKCNKCPYKEI